MGCFTLHFTRGLQMVYRLYGFGVVEGSASPKVYTYDINANDMDETWATPSKGEANTGSRLSDVFFYYKSYIYMWVAGALMRFDTRLVDDFNNAYYSSGVNHVYSAQPVHHPADDIAYFFHDNFVSKLDNTSWSEKVLTLPNDLRIVSAQPYGGYLAIGCTSIRSFNKKNIVYLWDRDTSLADVTESINLGDGTLRHVANLNNSLIAVMDYYNDSPLNPKKPKIIIKKIYGNIALPIKIITGDTLGSSLMTSANFIKEDKLYFPAKITFNGDDLFGIWVVDENGILTIDYIEEEADSYQGIYSLADMWWIAHSADGSVNYTSSSLFSSTLESSYESLIINNGDSLKFKKLIGITVFTEPLPASASVAISYRKDENLESTYTEIFTNSTENSGKHSAINIESTSVTLPEYKEIQYKIDSLGGAVILGVSYKYELVDKQLY
jgi:hypothetical protein